MPMMTPPPIVAASAKVLVPGKGYYDYFTADGARRRIYAAHSGARELVVIDADSKRVLRTVRVGPLHGVAVNPSNGHVFTGNGTDKSVSEVDPVAGRVLRTVKVGGPVDAIAYDPATKHIYADEDDGSHLYVIDASSMRLLKTLTLPAKKLEYLAVNPRTHTLYQNLTDRRAIAAIDGRTLEVKRVMPTPLLKGNHPLIFDAADDAIIDVGENGKLGVYSTSGALLHEATYPGGVDQCSFSARRRLLACFGTSLTLFSIRAGGVPELIGQKKIARGMHTGTIDPKNGDIWVGWPEGDRAYVEAFALAPKRP